MKIAFLSKHHMIKSDILNIDNKKVTKWVEKNFQNHSK